MQGVRDDVEPPSVKCTMTVLSSEMERLDDCHEELFQLMNAYMPIAHDIPQASSSSDILSSAKKASQVSGVYACYGPKPKEWYFSKGDLVVAGLWTGIVHDVHHTGLDVLDSRGALRPYFWHDIVKRFDVGDYVWVVGREFINRAGFVQDNTYNFYMEVLEQMGREGIDVCVSPQH